MSEELERFAELLVKNVRDPSVGALDRAFSDRGPRGDRWRQVEELPVADALRELIPDIVDEVVFQLLDAIDNDRLPLAWVTDSGEVARLSDLGSAEMGGSYAGGEWPRRFSSVRWTDLFPDLRLKDD